jgi:hypothetical protein
MSKTTIKVDLPEPLKTLAADRANRKHFSNLGAYMQHLIRADLERQRTEELIDLFVQRSYGDRSLTQEEISVWTSIFSITGTG